MRHRKVLNLYDTDKTHEDLLVHLEGIEGSTRQSQALLQMALIGFRVVCLHESGDEAYYTVRNPDVAKVAKRKISQKTVGQQRQSNVVPSVIEQDSVMPVQSINTAGNEDYSSIRLGEQDVELQEAEEENEYNPLKRLALASEER